MKDYLDKIKDYSKILTKCAKWENSNSSLFNNTKNTEKDKDYIYELYCYFVILKDLFNNYDLVYNPGSDLKEHIFPKSPARKKGYPFFYLLDKNTKKVLFQVCAGTTIKTAVGNRRCPDISFQDSNASLTDPNYAQTKMIFDAKRKRLQSKSQKLSLGQYSYFAIMITELQQQSAINTILNFSDFKDFNGNCLITNKKAYCGVAKRNYLHNMKEVENFNDNITISNLKIIG